MLAIIIKKIYWENINMIFTLTKEKIIYICRVHSMIRVRGV